MFLGLGASSLSIGKVPYNISIIMTILCIILVGLANFLNYYYTIIYLFECKERRSICNCPNCFNIKLFSIFFYICLNIYTLTEIIIHQILIYRTIGGIINIVGGYEYDSTFIFLENSFYNEIGWRLIINFFIAIFILYTLTLYKNDKNIFISSIIGFFIMLFIILVCSFQTIFYFINYYFNEYKEDNLNIFNIGIGFTNKLKFFQTLGIFFYCFSGQNHLIPALLRDKKEIKPFILSNSLNGIFYILISCCCYLSVPLSPVDIITERKRFWSKDINMTICRILLIPFSISKIQMNFNILNDIFFSFMIDKKQNDFNNLSDIFFSFMLDKYIKRKEKFIFNAIVLIITTFISILYQNIVGYITIVGGFFVVYPSFLYPQIKYRNDKNFKKHSNLRLFFGIVVFIIGVFSGILGLIDIIKGNE